MGPMLRILFHFKVAEFEVFDPISLYTIQEDENQNSSVVNAVNLHEGGGN